MDISNDKQKKFHTRKSGYVYENENSKRDTECLLIAAIRTNYFEAKTDNKQQNIKCWLWGEKGATFTHIIKECTELAQ